MLSKIKALESKLISGTGLTTFIMLNTKHIKIYMSKMNGLCVLIEDGFQPLDDGLGLNIIFRQRQHGGADE